MEMKFLIAGVMVMVAAFSAAIGNSWLFSKYVEGVARQPETRGIFIQLMILFGLVEALPIIAVGLGIMIFFGVI